MAQRDRAASRASRRPDRPEPRPDRDRADRDRATARPEGPDPAAHRGRLRAVVGPVVEQAGYDLEDLTVSRAGRRHLLRVVVDAEGGVSLDEVAELSRDISTALDQAEETGGAFTAGEYVLEVGSPGVDRPLTQPRHWRRNIGRLVSVTAADREPAPGPDRPVTLNRRMTGRIAAADDRGVTLETDGQRHSYGYPDLGPGRVQIEFGRLDNLGDDEISDEFADLDEEREEDEE
jgi:ribosome maturation factor RimP